ncbi:putative mitochondrial protein, partial [Mucuna pruriens]
MHSSIVTSRRKFTSNFPMVCTHLPPNIVCKLKHSLYGLKQAPRYDPSLFLQRTPKCIVVLLVYVDDIVVIGFDQKTISKIKHMLHSNFHMKELDLVQLVGLTNSTLVDPPVKINKGDILDDPTLYCKLVSSLIYVTITCLDIYFAIHTISKFMQSPRHFHFSVVQRIVRYLLGTSKHGLFVPIDSSLNLQAYSDANWAGCPNTKKIYY